LEGHITRKFTLKKIKNKKSMDEKLDTQARSCLYAKKQLLAHHFGKKIIVCFH
jgi:hypothetical protein